MDNPLTIWYCDKCNQPITHQNDGYVIWHGGITPRQFRVIHVGRCDDKSFDNSLALPDLLGADGLTRLLSLLDAGPIIRNTTGQHAQQVPDLFDFVDLVRRLHTPYYEEARQKFSRPDVIDDYCDSNEYAPYISKNLLEIAKRT